MKNEETVMQLRLSFSLTSSCLFSILRSLVITKNCTHMRIETRKVDKIER